MQTRPWITLALVGLALALGFSPAGAGTFELSREALFRGEIWRLFTGHLVHFNTDHLLWDVVVFGLLGAVLEKDGRKRLAVTLAASALACSGAALLSKPVIDTYRGLSGIDSALFGLLAGRLVLAKPGGGSFLPKVLACTAFLGFAAKTVWEVGTQTTAFAATNGDFVPVPMAHLLGIAVGGVIALLWKEPNSPENRARPALVS